MKKHWHRARKIVKLTIMGLAMAWLWPLAADELPWKNEMFSKSVFEEDIRVILAEILKRNGQEVAFAPDVSGEVTLELTGIPLQVAFAKLMEESSLGFTYAARTNMVSIFKQNQNEIIEEVFVAKTSTISQILPTLAQFRYDASGVEFAPDYGTNAIFLKGQRKKVASLMNVLEKVDEAIKSRQLRELAEKQRSLKLAGVDQELENTHITVKVIPLRFATVAQQKIAFQGETVTLPGIIDSLEAFMGLQDKGKEGGKVHETVTAIPPPVISSDQRTNSVIIQGTPQQISRIGEIVAMLDQAVPLIEIKVLIVDGEANLMRELGVQWGGYGNVGPHAANQPMQQFDANNNLVTNRVSPAVQTGALALTSRPDNTASNTAIGFIYRGAREVLDANLAVLSSDNKLQTIASPHVITMNNQTAKITNSKNVNFVVTTGDGTNTDVKTVNAGNTLDITPSVIEPAQAGDSRLVRLKVNIKNAAITSQTGSSVNTDEQEMQTSIILPEGATYITGGLFSTRRNEVASGVPGLQDMPLLGSLFRFNKSEDRKAETVFMITPKVYHIHDILAVADHNAPRFATSQQVALQAVRGEIQRESRLLPIKRSLVEEE